MRAFIALELPADIKKKIESILDFSRNIFIPGIKWVQKNNLHITLKFFGNLDFHDLAKAKRIFKKNFATYSAIEFSKARIELFPQMNPSLIWIRLQNNQNLPQLLSHLNTDFANLDYDYEKRDFISHITLGRVKKLNDSQLKKLNKILQEADTIPDFTSNAATFYQSKLKPSGPEYISLANYKLTN